MRLHLKKRGGTQKWISPLDVRYLAGLCALYLFVFLPTGLTSTFAITPKSVSTSGLISAGRYHTCAMTTTSNAKVKCWGRNDYGQIGNGTTLDGPVNPTEVSSLSGVSMVAAGFQHTCALIAADGSIKCWGRNDFGQLGDNSTTTRTTPVQVVDGSNTVVTDAVIIAAGFSHTCAIFSDGSVKCWGSNSLGQLGDGSYSDSHVPVGVSGFSSGSTASAISAGEDHTCLVDATTNEVKCFGNNAYGALGQGSTGGSSFIPLIASGIADATDVTCGSAITCAKLSTGGLKCWGANGKGAIGDGTTTDSNVPVLIAGMGSDTDSVEIGGSAFSANHSCAVLSSTTEVACWGYGNGGQIGDGSNVQRNSPTLVSSLLDVREVSAGGAHTCAIVLPYAAKCWGDNVWGQLGDGTTTSSNVPVNVPPFGPGTPTPTPTTTPTASPSATPEACSSETSCRPDSSLTTPLNPRSPALTVIPPATAGAPIALSVAEVKLGIPVSPARRAVLKSKLQNFFGKKISNLAKAIKSLQVFYVINIVKTTATSAWEFQNPGEVEAYGGLPTRYKAETRKRRVTARLAPGYYAATVSVRIKDSKGRIFTTGKASAPVKFRVR